MLKQHTKLTNSFGFHEFPSYLFDPFSLSALILTGCTATVQDAQSQQDASASSTPTQDPAEVAVEQAKTLTASYDYDAALKALSNVSGEAVDAARTEIEAQKSKAVLWEDNSQIPHLFVHSLIVDTDRAFDGDHQAQGYADYIVTVDEFRKILKQLHANNYVLINPNYVATAGKDGTMSYQPIYLPAGKKPVVLSQDDVNYYEYMSTDGLAANLTFDEEGKVVNIYYDAAGKKHLGEYDMPPIVDAFVKENPDFSYRGSKGILAVTGYNGVLGYRTSKIAYPDNKHIEEDTQKARKVADALKKDGWVFASHSWGHPAYGKIAPAALAEDNRKWVTEVEPIVGKTPHLIYPFGSDISGIEPYAGAKYATLQNSGFTSFYNVDASTTAWVQLNGGYYRQARINLDGIRFGYALSGKEKLLDGFIDVRSVVDPARPGL